MNLQVFVLQNNMEKSLIYLSFFKHKKAILKCQFYTENNELAF